MDFEGYRLLEQKTVLNVRVVRENNLKIEAAHPFETSVIIQFILIT